MSAESVVSQLLGSEAVIAVQAVAEAAWLVKWIQREAAVGTLRKSDASVVTVADYAAQALIAARLSTAFPGVPLVAEEDAAALRGAAVHEPELLEPAVHSAGGVKDDDGELAGQRR